MKPRAILETSVYCRDLAAARRFYTEVMGLEVLIEQANRHVFFKLGRGMFLVFNPDHTARESTVINGVTLGLHGVAGQSHMAFAILESEIDRWREHLTRSGVAIETELRWPNGGHSLYFRDPAGNSIEVATPRLWGMEEAAFDS